MAFYGYSRNFPFVNPFCPAYFERASSKAGILKAVSIHRLQNSFATHLLEQGTDIRYIKELLGHTSIRTTERYTYVARGNVLNIQSPLEDM
jgi:site-specific recombinase XerD